MDKLVEFSNTLISSLANNPEAVGFAVSQYIESTKIYYKTGSIISLSFSILFLITGIVYSIWYLKNKTKDKYTNNGHIERIIASFGLSVFGFLLSSFFLHGYFSMVKAPLFYVLPKIFKTGL